MNNGRWMMLFGFLMCVAGAVLYVEVTRLSGWAIPTMIFWLSGVGLFLAGRAVDEDGTATKQRVVQYLVRGAVYGVGGRVLWGMVAALSKALAKQ